MAAVALRAIDQHGFALAGAGALVTHGVITRPTQDLDLFSPAQGGPAQVSAALLTALTEAGCQVQVLEPAEQHGGEFLRLQVRRGEHVADIDLARNWRQHPPVQMQIGPVLHVEDAVAGKVTAMIGRGLPRDYIDAAASLRRDDRDDLLRLAFYRDPGLRVPDVALCMQLLDRLPDAPFADYGLTDDDVRRSGTFCKTGRATTSRTTTAAASTPRSTSRTARPPPAWPLQVSRPRCATRCVKGGPHLSWDSSPASTHSRPHTANIH
jgi:hypothetical protein